MVCVVLGVLGYGLMNLRQFLPQQPANDMQLESDEFLRQGAPQRIDWRTLDARPFAEARRLNRPVMLVLGTVWSREARMADQNIFVDADIQSYLSRHFVCVRVDLDAHPEWGSAFLPLSRGPIGLAYGFQVMYLDPQGRLFDFYGRAGLIPLVDPTEFIDEFVRARRAYDDLGSGREGVLAPGALQDGDLNLIETGRVGAPRIREFMARISESIDPRHGGFGVTGTQTPRPSALMALLYAGEVGQAKNVIDPMLRTGFVDWLDGGFFRRARQANWTDLDFDKLAIGNAEMMRALAVYGVISGDKFPSRIAMNAFDALAGEFSDTGLVATARIGDSNAVGRSPRSSFAAKDLRRVWGTGMLTSEDSDKARRLFGLTVERNPQMTIKVEDPQAMNDPDFDRLLGVLRQHKSEVPIRFTRRAYAHVGGSVTALMYIAARLWGDAGRLALADLRYDALGAFGSGNDVRHGTTQMFDDEPYLGDYLALVDANLARFLAHGDLRALSRADVLLARSETLFGNPNGWTPLIAKRDRIVPDTDVPEILDTPAESQAAKTVRLNNALGRLLRGYDNEAASRRIESALTIATHYGGLLHELGLPASGLVAATMPLLDDAHAFYVGPGAVEQASKLFRMVPTRLVAPAIGPVRSDLQSREPGFYVVRGPEVSGPFTLEAAAANLGSRYRLPDGMP